MAHREGLERGSTTNRSRRRDIVARVHSLQLVLELADALITRLRGTLSASYSMKKQLVSYNKVKESAREAESWWNSHYELTLNGSSSKEAPVSVPPLGIAQLVGYVAAPVLVLRDHRDLVTLASNFLRFHLFLNYKKVKVQL